MSTATRGRFGSEERTLRNYVNGGWTTASGSGTLDVLDPSTGAQLARVRRSTAEDVEAAVAAARRAQAAWARTPVVERARRLFRLRHLVDAHREEYAQLLVRDTGKALTDARLEVARMLETIECATAIPQTMQGRALGRVATGIDAETFREPVGVCAAITPFNFPAMLLMWFLPFAIGCGNTVVVKPSEQTPLVPELTFRLLEQLELPPGTVNLVNGGGEAAEALLEADVDAVSFVGSAPNARHVYQRAAATGKRVQAFGGAKNHMVVLPDAVTDQVATNIATSAFGGAGQRCMAGAALVAVGGVWERLREPLLARARALRVGDGLDPDVGLGPVVSEVARERICKMIAGAVEEGARLALDGRAPDVDRGGAFVGPTVLEHVTPAMEIGREEVFGPVLSVIEVDTLDEALELVNRSRYGNGASIFTESGAAARRFREDVQAGMIGVNVGIAAPVAFFPFGGWKASFLGDVGACAQEAIAFYTRNKTVTSRWYSSGAVGRYFVEA